MTVEDARAFARALPDVTEEPHFDKASFRTRKKIFATLPPDGSHIHIFVDEPEVRWAIGQAASACQELWWGKRLVGVRVRLAVADEGMVRELLTVAWRLRHPG